MKYKILFVFVFVTFFATGQEAVDYVNPFIGTNYGATNPGAIAVRGMASVSPFNGVGCPDLGVIIAMPTTGNIKTNHLDYGTTYTDELPEFLKQGTIQLIYQNII